MDILILQFVTNGLPPPTPITNDYEINWRQLSFIS